MELINLRVLAVVLVFLFSNAAYACDTYVLGFRGVNGAFDTQAFEKYVGKRCSRLYNSNQTQEAVNFINNITVPYELYGFSLGAQSVRIVLKNAYIKPKFVLTIGAYHTANVNFDKYGVEYKNYFDGSGKLQKSPGIYVPNVQHMKMQEYVNKEMLK